jgi:HAD superfamily hydrolase (TIGR01549 family)
MSPKAIIFDYDGVLVNSMSVILASAETSLRRLGSPKKVQERDVWALEPMEWGSFADRLGITKVQRDSFVQNCLDIYRKNSFSLEFYVGMPELLVELSRSLPIGIVSGNGEKAIRERLRMRNLENLFKEVLGLEAGISKADKLTRFASLLGCGSEELIYIGDAGSDIEACHECGAVSVAVAWGNQSRSLLLSKKPNFLCESIDELRALLKSRLEA